MESQSGNSDLDTDQRSDSPQPFLFSMFSALREEIGCHLYHKDARGLMDKVAQSSRCSEIKKETLVMERINDYGTTPPRQSFSNMLKTPVC